MHTLNKYRIRFAAVALTIGSFVGLDSCKMQNETVLDRSSASARIGGPDYTFYALTDGNQLLLLSTANPETPLSSVPVTNLQAGDRIMGIDFRPATGQLYGVSNTSRLYTINPVTGAASMVGAGPFSTMIMSDGVAFDFNPTVDRIRLVTNSGQNFRLNPDNGTIAATDGNINGASGAVVTGAAYTNNRAGATTTTLYVIDPVTDKLYTQNPPNNGTLVAVGPLGVDAAGSSGFDISADGTSALASLGVGGRTELHQINLATGKADKVGNMPSQSIIGLAIPTEPVVTGVTGPNTVFYTLTDGNQLLQLNATSPGTVLSTVSVTNLQSGDRIMGIDFRPATGQLYGVSNTSRLYTINPLTGRATMVGAGPFAPMSMNDGVAFDFNPTVDRIRLVVSGTGVNLRLNPETGTIAATDGSINGAPNAVVTGAAYTNNKSGSTTTTLYVIDPVTDQLYIQNPPNNGTLVAVGPLGVDAAGSSGFDISADGTSALATLGVGGRTGLYVINLATGRANKVGDLPNQSLIGLAIPTEPVAYAVDGANNLLIFNPLNPGTPISKAITGLAAGASVYGIDFRPANGQLYALGSNSQIYTINTSSGAAAAVGTPFTPALSGTDFGFDFNPTVDRIRVISNSGQNLRLNPETGAVAAVDGTINPSNLMPTGAAYTNNFAGATTTVLYDIDISAGQLVRQDPPNNGTLTPVGPLGVAVEGANGFDITGTTGTAYALFRSNPSSPSKVYRIDLNTGAATAVADFPTAVKAMAVGLGF